MLDPTHGAPGPPPHTPRLAQLAPHAKCHLEGHLVDRRRVTWWWVSPISPLCPISFPAPLLRVETRMLPLLRGSGLPGRILAPGIPLLTPRVPSLLTPLSLPPQPPPHPACHSPCHPPPCYHSRLPCHHRRPHRCPPRPPGLGPAPPAIEQEELPRHPEGARPLSRTSASSTSSSFPPPPQRTPGTPPTSPPGPPPRPNPPTPSIG